MKLAGPLFALVSTALPLTANAYCTFRLKVANSVNPSLNGLYVQSLNNIATLGPPFTNVTLAFPSGNDAGPSILQSTGFSDEGTGLFALAPSLGVERLIFADPVPAGARSAEWAIPNPTVNTALTYGSVVDRFVVYSPGSPIAHYEIYWVPQGTMFGGWPVDLVAECVEGSSCSA